MIFVLCSLLCFKSMWMHFLKAVIRTASQFLEYISQKWKTFWCFNQCSIKTAGFPLNSLETFTALSFIFLMFWCWASSQTFHTVGSILCPFETVIHFVHSHHLGDLCLTLGPVRMYYLTPGSNPYFLFWR